MRFCGFNFKPKSEKRNMQSPMLVRKKTPANAATTCLDFPRVILNVLVNKERIKREQSVGETLICLENREVHH